MDGESLFKLLFVIIFIPFLFSWIWKFLRTGIKKESIYTLREGIISAFLFRILQTLSFIGIILYLFYPSLIIWANLDIPDFIRYIGFPVGLFVLILIFSAYKSIGKNYHASLNIKEGHKLITNGLYAWVRHPLYVLFCIIWICFFLLTSNYFVGLTGVLSYVVIFFGRVPREEKLMRDEFGKEYDVYFKKTGKFFPRL